MDYAAAAAELEEAQRRAEPKVKELDWAKRDHLEISPLTFPREVARAAGCSARNSADTPPSLFLISSSGPSGPHRGGRATWPRSSRRTTARC